MDRRNFHAPQCSECGFTSYDDDLRCTPADGTATCEVCNTPYGEPDSSGLTGHPNPTIEEKPGTCYDEGYYCITCDEEPTVPCTIFTAERFSACPICGKYEGGVLLVVYAHDAGESLPYGTLVIRGSEIAVDGALHAITVAGSYGGQVVGLIAPVTVSVPMELTSFRVVDMNGVDVPFTLEDGVLTFETATAGLFLLVPAE